MSAVQRGGHSLVVGFTLWYAPVSERLQSSTGGRGGSWENVPTTLNLCSTQRHGKVLESYFLYVVVAEKLGSKLAAGY